MDIYAPLNNKYYRWYLSIITTAQQRPKPKEYCEEHHVIPRCLGGINRKINLVFLTAKEHYIVHHLLCYCFEDHFSRFKMIKAFNRMNNSANIERPNRYMTPIGYAIAKKLHSETMKGENNPMYGKIKEQNAMFGRLGSKHPKYGHTCSMETLMLMKQAQTEAWTRRTPENRVAWNKGIPLIRTDEGLKAFKKAVAKEFTLINPQGNIQIIFNMNEFCRDNNLSNQQMGRLFRGKIKSGNYKGWKQII